MGTEFEVVPSALVFEHAGELASLQVVTDPTDGYKTLRAVFTDGKEMKLAHPENYSGYTVGFKKGSVIAIRSFVVPAVNTTTGVIADEKRYLIAEGNDLSVLATRDEYIAAGYPRQPRTVAAPASQAF